MLTTTRYLGLALIALAALGCRAEDEDSGGSDGGVTPDARMTPDAARADARPTPDGAPTPDAKAAYDADLPDAPPVPSPDAWVPPDAALPPDALVVSGTCDMPGELTAGVAVGGTTSLPSHHVPNEPSPCIGAAGGEAVYRFQLDEVADLVWEVEMSGGFDPVAYVRKDCDGIDPDGTPIGDATCSDVIGSNERVELLEASPGTYYFFVDGYGELDNGSFTATLTVRSIVGLGEPCDDVTARCQTGLACLGTCMEEDMYCPAVAMGTLMLGVPVTGDTTDAVDHIQCAASGFDNDEFWALTADAEGGTYNAWVISPDHNVWIYNSANCIDAASAANCSGGFVKDANFDMVLGPGESTYVVVDGFAGEKGTYELVVELVTFLAPGDPCSVDDQRLVRCPGGYVCDGTTCVAACGNGDLDPGERCDDGSVESGDGCSAECQDELSYLETDEVEPNHLSSEANSIQAPAWVSGAKTSEEDVDVFAVPATQGDLIVAETVDGATTTCRSFRLDSRIRILAPDGLTELGANDDIAMNNYCSFLNVLAPADGLYFVALDASPLQPKLTFDYGLRVLVWTPASLGEIEPNDTWDLAQPLLSSGRLSGSTSSTADIDFVGMIAPAGFLVFSETTDGATSVCATNSLDSKLRLLAADGTTVLATSDDEGAGFCSRLGYMPLQASSLYLGLEVVTGAPVFDYTWNVFVVPR